MNKEITLLDYFAGRALPIIMADQVNNYNRNIATDSTEKDFERVAFNAYNMASVMLKTKKIFEKSIGNDSIIIKKIDHLSLSTRVKNCLRAEGIYTLHDLLQYPRIKVAKIPNMGRQSMMELEFYLETHNLELKND
jgi:DNA-directed RNA polymerase alpha subunit